MVVGKETHEQSERDSGGGVDLGLCRRAKSQSCAKVGWSWGTGEEIDFFLMGDEPGFGHAESEVSAGHLSGSVC